MSDIVNKEQIKKFFDVLKLEYDYVIMIHLLFNQYQIL